MKFWKNQSRFCNVPISRTRDKVDDNYKCLEMEEEQCLPLILRLSNTLTHYTRNITHVISRVSYVVACRWITRYLVLYCRWIFITLYRVAQQFNFNFLANLLYLIALRMLVTLRANVAHLFGYTFEYKCSSSEAITVSIISIHCSIDNC